MNVVRIINQLITPDAYITVCQTPDPYDFYRKTMFLNQLKRTPRTPKYAHNLSIAHSGIPWWLCKQVLKMLKGSTKQNDSDFSKNK